MRFFLFRVLFSLIIASSATTRAQSDSDRPQLVVLVSIDMLRGDSIDRIRDRTGPNGFRYFLEHGFEYRNAHYRHAGTVTAAGHATLVTGASSGTHGIVGNSWFDTQSNQRVYCTKDEKHLVHGEKANPQAGSSPVNLLVPTLGDEMRAQLNSDTRVYGVSAKDRSAILMAGRSGRAFWLSRPSQRFSTSSYYFDRGSIPVWMRQFQDQHPVTKFAGQNWQLLHERDSYVLADHDARTQEVPPSKWTTEFPHTLPTDTKELTRYLLHSPYADIYTLEFVEALLDGEKVGRSDVTDLLAISFSATDYIGHAFGPHSLEYEDNLLRIDQRLQELMNLLEDRVGLANVTIALSADHGVDAIPEFRKAVCSSFASGERKQTNPFSSILDREHDYAKSDGPECDAGRHEPADFMRVANRAMRAQFGMKQDPVIAYWHPNLYLDEAMLRSKSLALEEVSHALAEFMSAQEGIALALTRADLMSDEPTNDARIERMRRGFHPTRSGHVVLTTQRFWYLYQSSDGDASMHGSPYAYDTHVPMLLAGFGIRRGSSDANVAPSDLAPTLARILGVKMTKAQGTPLLDCLLD